MRAALSVALGCLAATACGEPVETPTDTKTATVISAAPYAGEWAAAPNSCADEGQVWTIEARRMAIVPAMRFCAFNDVYVNTASDKGATTYSAAASCLAEGQETRDFVFFRVKDNLREMRVTFNDTDAVKLVRCPIKS